MEREILKDAMIMTNKNTFYRGWVRPKFDKEGTFALGVNADVHPYIKVGDKIEFVDVLVPYEKRVNNT